jgi:hypothetical protein
LSGVLAGFGEEIGHGAAGMPVGPGVRQVIGAIQSQVAALAHGAQVVGVFALASFRVQTAAEVGYRQHHARAGERMRLPVAGVASLRKGLAFTDAHCAIGHSLTELVRMIVAALAYALTATARPSSDLSGDPRPIGRIFLPVHRHVSGS